MAGPPGASKSRKEGCCSVPLVKNFSHIYNIIFFVGGGSAIAVGLWTILMKHQYVSLLPSVTYQLTAYILLTAGVLTLFVSIAGCCSIHRENRCSLLMYIFLLLLIFLMEAMVGVLSFVYKEQVLTELNHNLNTTFTQTYNVSSFETKAIDAMQQEYKCCGATSFENWEYSEWKKSHKKMKVPDSCCKTPSPGCGKSNHPSNIPYSGCIHRLSKNVREQLEIIGVVALGISVVPIFGMFLSCCVYMKLRKYQY